MLRTILQSVSYILITASDETGFFNILFRKCNLSTPMATNQI